MLELKVPPFGESIVEGTITRWIKQPGQPVKTDEAVVEIETEKITVEVPSPGTGVLQSISKKTGEKVTVGELLGLVDETQKAAAAAPAVKPEAQESKAKAGPVKTAPVAEAVLMPAARRVADELGVDASQINGSGRGGRILKEDVVAAGAAAAKRAPAAAPAVSLVPRSPSQRERRVAMTPMRQRIAERLLEAQSNAAILTTFNEADVSAVMDLRKRYQDKFVEKYGIKLGFMSFFVKAVIEGLKAFPAVNAEIEGNEIVYKDYYDIGVAVGGGKGLVVPVVRDADQKGLAELEKTISEYGVKAKANKLTLEDMRGGTFTISNGGVYGSLLSTLILNPPQSGILGMHTIQERPVVRAGQVVVRPMMYLALSYDHRMVDGREAVSFLVRVKECIEDPERLLLEI